MDKQFFVYMMAGSKRGTIYAGVTSNLVARVYQHRTHPGFRRDGFGGWDE